MALKFKKLSFLVPERHIKYNFDTLFEIKFFFNLLNIYHFNSRLDNMKKNKKRQ